MASSLQKGRLKKYIYAFSIFKNVNKHIPYLRVTNADPTAIKSFSFPYLTLSIHSYYAISLRPFVFCGVHLF